MLLVSAAGFVVGCGYVLYRYRTPSLQDAALALEARLAHDTGALAAALRVEEGNSFYRPLLANAADELTRAQQCPAPLLITTRGLVVVPLLALVSAVSFAAVVSADPVQGVAALNASEQATKGTPWASVDVDGHRSTADRDAYRKALGMKETAAKLTHSAAVLREPGAGEPQLGKALADAREALREAAVAGTELKPEEIPAVAPPDASGKSELADKIDAAASSIRSAATAAEKGTTAGTYDSGGGDKFNPTANRENLVPMPAMQSAVGATAQSIGAQTPQRRALADRAVKALEKRRER